jgi:hypothetical protein
MSSVLSLPLSLSSLPPSLFLPPFLLLFLSLAFVFPPPFHILLFILNILSYPLFLHPCPSLSHTPSPPLSLSPICSRGQMENSGINVIFYLMMLGSIFLLFTISLPLSPSPSAPSIFISPPLLLSLPLSLSSLFFTFSLILSLSFSISLSLVLFLYLSLSVLLTYVISLSLSLSLSRIVYPFCLTLSISVCYQREFGKTRREMTTARGLVVS